MHLQYYNSENVNEDQNINKKIEPTTVD